MVFGRATHAGETPAESDNGARRGAIEEIQRARLLAATFEVTGERGALVSVAELVKVAGISRRTFYELFEDREQCLLAAFEQGTGLAVEHVLAAWRSERGWREQVRAALVALLAFLDEQPAVARLLIVESHTAGEAVLKRRAGVLAQLVEALDRGAREAGRSAVGGTLSAEVIVGGALGVLHARLLDPDRAPLAGLTSPLMHMIVLPYLGAAAARRELERPAPPAVRRSKRASPPRSDPFREANMRLTYRTVRVLAAVAEHPGASNRKIGEASGITDQGQISKLLARLRGAGMLQNATVSLGRGAQNVWTLTATGRHVVASIEAHGDGLSHQYEYLSQRC